MLKKKEVIYRYILSQALEKKQLSFTQLQLSKNFNISLSTVNNALKPLERIGAIEKRTRSFEILDMKKALIFWASERKFNRDIVYRTRSDMPIMKIEGSMPDKIVFTAFSAYRLKYDEAPADYSEVYVYADKETLGEIKSRFPLKKGPANIIVLEKDPYMSDKPIIAVSQLYVDLWNIREWYAKDFLDALEKRLFG
jgi:DNA-binding transcriptional MocR family regulator